MKVFFVVRSSLLWLHSVKTDSISLFLLKIGKRHHGSVALASLAAGCFATDLAFFRKNGGLAQSFVFEVVTVVAGKEV